MRNAEQRIEKLESQLEDQEPATTLVCLYHEGEDMQSKQVQALGKYNSENGTAYAENEINWIIVHIVWSRNELKTTAE